MNQKQTLIPLTSQKSVIRLCIQPYIHTLRHVARDALQYILTASSMIQIFAPFMQIGSLVRFCAKGMF